MKIRTGEVYDKQNTLYSKHNHCIKTKKVTYVLKDKRGVCVCVCVLGVGVDKNIKCSGTKLGCIFR